MPSAAGHDGGGSDQRETGAQHPRALAAAEQDRDHGHADAEAEQARQQDQAKGNGAVEGRAIKKRGMPIASRATIASAIGG